MSAAGQINAGGRIFATAIRGVAPEAAFKAGDENRVTNTTPSNDSALFLPNLQASAQYFVVCFLDYEGGTLGASDLKWTFSTPSAATMRYHAQYLSTGGTAQIGVTHAGADVVTAGTAGSGTLRAVTMTGTLQMAATAGTLQFQWAQSTSSATPTVMHAQSILAAWQVG
jgi:hypothetical protein